VTEGLHEHARPFRRELARKAIHLTSATVPIALAAGVDHRVAATVLGALLIAAIAVELLRARVASAATRFDAIFGALLRAHESRDVTGATWLIGAMFAAVLLLPRSPAIAATWAAAVGDAAAALVGMRFGRHRSRRDGKSLEGSAACFLATLLGALLLAQVGLAAGLLIGAAAAVAERMPWPRDDNVRIIAVVGVTAMMAATL
jgi:dolichol kinase